VRRKLTLISNEIFLERIKCICPIKTQIISKYDTYVCGCQSKHTVSWNGGKIIRQTGMYEYVIYCPKGYLTLIEYNFRIHDIRSLLSTKISNTYADLVQLEEYQSGLINS